MHRVATHVIEVRGGRVVSYPASYDDYVYRMEKEIDAGLRAPHTVATPGNVPTRAPAARKAGGRSDRDAQKKLKSVERKIAKLDDEKKAAAETLLTVTDAAEAQRLHAQVAQLTIELATLEDEWLSLSEDVNGE
jgi:ATP-binding cassette subfamily F protein 3